MSRTTCMCLNLEGALRNLTNDSAGAYLHDDGRPMNYREAHAALCAEIRMGREVTPMNDVCANPCPRAAQGCTGFVYAGEKSGCPGYNTEAS